MKTDKKSIYIYGGGVLLIAALIYYAYKQGKKQTTISPLPENDNPTGGIGETNENLSTLATNLYDEMSGFNWSGHDSTPYKKAVLLSDIDFVRLYNIFNIKYQGTSEQTLTGWFDSETFFVLGSADNSIYKTFSDNLSKLNLK
jgi:hypothetical protein